MLEMHVFGQILSKKGSETCNLGIPGSNSAEPKAFYGQSTAKLGFLAISLKGDFIRGTFSRGFGGGFRVIFSFN